MAITSDNLPPEDQQQLSRYIHNLETRYPSYIRSHREELKHDALSRLIADYLFSGTRTHFEAGLQGMLNDTERELLSTDPVFTRAWQIFIDICWLKRKLSRLGIMLGIILGIFGLIVLLFLAAPHVVGPKAR